MEDPPRCGNARLGRRCPDKFVFRRKLFWISPISAPARMEPHPLFRRAANRGLKAVVEDLCDRVIIINHGRIVTDDHVDNLLRLFAVRSYTITLGQLLSDQQLQLIKKAFPHLEYIPDTTQAIIKVDFDQDHEIYDLFELLKMNKTPVESIEQGTINFEQVFMRIIKGEEAHALV